MDDEPTTPPANAEPEGLIFTERCDEHHPGLAPALFLVERWRAARSAQPDCLPSRDLFTPETLGGLLGRVSLLEPVDGGQDFRYRIHAGIAADVARLDLSRRMVSDLPYADYREVVLDQYRSALADQDVRFDRIRLNWFGTVFDYVRITLPVADPATDSPSLLSIMLHTDPERPTYQSRFRPAAVDSEQSIQDEC